MFKQRYYKKFLANFTKGIFTVFISVLVIYGVVQAGNLIPPSGVPSSQFFTISDIYNRLTTNSTATEGGHSFTFSDSLTGGGKTLTEVYNAIPTIDATQVRLSTPYLGITGTLVPSGGDALVGDVLIGKTFFGGSQSDWNTKTGTMPNKVGSGTIFTPSIADQAITQGYYGGIVDDGKVLGDGDLISANIASGINIFGVNGDSNVVDTSSGDAIDANILLGKIAFVDGSSVTGAMPNKSGLADFNPTSTDVAIPTGFYDGITKINGDTDLMDSNILSGVNIFGVSGTLDPTPSYGDDNPAKVLNTASNPGTYDVATCTTNYNTTNLTIGTVKASTVFGDSLIGEYPSATYPLSGNTDTNATDGNILTGYEAWNKAGTHIAGAMPIQSLSDTSVNVPAGYYGAGTALNAIDTDLTSANILTGVTIFGVPGTASTGYTYGNSNPAYVLTIPTGPGAGNYDASNLSVGTVKNNTSFGVGLTGQYPSASYPLSGSIGTDAIAGNILSGLDAWNKTGTHISGTMTNKVGTNTIFTPSTTDQAITQGYYGGVVGDGKVLGDADLAVGNIRSGVNIFNVNGTLLGDTDATKVLGTATTPGTALKNLWNGSLTAGGFNGGSQALGGVDDYNANNAAGRPATSYPTFTAWTQCISGNNWCQTDTDNDGNNNEAGADAQDNSTGLIWSLPCNGNGCTSFSDSAPGAYSWDNSATPGSPAGATGNNGNTASALCSNAGWSLPHQKQLMQAYIDGSWDKNLGTGLEGVLRSYWSATTYSYGTTNAWLTTLSYGLTSLNTKTTPYGVRCVR